MNKFDERVCTKYMYLEENNIKHTFTSTKNLSLDLE